MRYVLIFASLWVFFGCQSEELVGVPPYSSIARVLGNALVEDCPNGGVIIGYGIDRNFNGILDENEITGSEILCHGENGMDGADGESCTVVDNGDGSYTMTCPDGSTVTFYDGEDGSDGVDGTNGTDGSDGSNGSDGVDGTNGTDGSDGSNGSDGVDGTNGTDGSDGTDGTDGVNGLDGADGQNGTDGVNGIDGEDGQPCTTTDNLDGTYTLTCPDGSSVVISDGADGVSGVDGQDGQPCVTTDNLDGTYTLTCPDGSSVVVSDGVDGINGSDGVDGTNGTDGIDGTNGTDGQNGTDGINGIDGEDGQPCTTTDNLDGTYTLTCPDGSSVVISDGADGVSGVDGQDGQPCVTTDNLDGTYTLTCPDGSSVVISDGVDGQDGVNGTDGIDGTNGTDGQNGTDGVNGVDGEDGQPCTTTDNLDGTYTLTCPDGSSVVISDGADGVSGVDGQDGQPCVTTDNLDGTYTLTCPDGSSVVISDGADGLDGLNGSDGTDGVDGQDADPCVVVEHGDGTATITCPDGSSTTFITLPETPEGYVLVHAGEFLMGSPDTELTRESDETQHLVTLTRSFYVKMTEVTQGEWAELATGRPDWNPTPSHFSSCGAQCPVERVNWWEALHYANAKSEADGVTPCYIFSGCTSDRVGDDRTCDSVSFQDIYGDPVATPLECAGYRLPTEAEWEFAYRAGTQTSYYSGEILVDTLTCTNPDPALDAIAWYCVNAGSETHPVAGKAANGWGLFDMAGNVREWVWDTYDETSHNSGARVDPVGDGGGLYTVVRGGGYGDGTRPGRAADRIKLLTHGVYREVGFRLVRRMPQVVFE